MDGYRGNGGRLWSCPPEGGGLRVADSFPVLCDSLPGSTLACSLRPSLCTPTSLPLSWSLSKWREVTAGNEVLEDSGLDEDLGSAFLK